METTDMKEKLYTIPLNDAVNENDECPFCFIERKLEQDMINFVLGSSSSYMESDIREQTDKIGFCRTHMKKMFDYGNTLGNSLILKTHYQNINAPASTLILRILLPEQRLDVMKRCMQDFVLHRVYISR